MQSSAKLKIFHWKGVNKGKQHIQGSIEAISIRFAKIKLHEQQIQVNKIYRSYQWPSFLTFKRKISYQEITLFTRQLATLLTAGIPLLQALEITTQNYKQAELTQTLRHIQLIIQEGASLSQSLASYPQYFNSLMRQFIHTGEQTGSLDTMLQHIATYQEKGEKIRAKIKKALLYPCAVIVIAIVITCAMLIFIVPQFTNLFESFGATLPLPTQVTIQISQFLIHQWWLLLLAVITPTIIIKIFLKKSRRFLKTADRLILKLPLVGTLLKKGVTTNLCRMLAITHAAGIPLLESLSNIANLTTHTTFHAAINDIQTSLQYGKTLHKALQETHLFSKMTLQMVAIGEESGKLDEMLNKIADFYESEIHQLVDGLSQLLEPLIMVILGIVIGSLVVTMYLPVFKLGTVL